MVTYSIIRTRVQYQNLCGCRQSYKEIFSREKWKSDMLFEMFYMYKTRQQHTTRKMSAAVLKTVILFRTSQKLHFALSIVSLASETVLMQGLIIWICACGLSLFLTTSVCEVDLLLISWRLDWFVPSGVWVCVCAKVPDVHAADD